MRIFLPLVGLAMLAACDQDQSADQQAAATPPAPTAPHSNAQPGTYVQTRADGSTMTTFMATDGTYTNWVAGAMTESGKWAVENDKTCFHPEKGDARCGSDGPIQPDGSFTVVPDGGEPFVVRKTA